MSENTNDELQKIENDNNGVVIENDRDRKVKYRKPYVMTEKRKKSIERMQKAREAVLTQKRKEKEKMIDEKKEEALRNKIMELENKLRQTQEKHMTDEIRITKPVKIEKEQKKDTSFEDMKHDMNRMKQILETLIVQPQANQPNQYNTQMEPSRENTGIKYLFGGKEFFI